MARRSRTVVPGVAHHCTQRGTDKRKVFFTDGDRGVYLDLLKEHCDEAGLRVLAYCLMPNHVHLVAIPERLDSLAVVFRRVHGRYSQYLNVRRGRSGHLWQNRFYSCALDEHHLLTALRYVESNPVRAGLVAQAESYAWSSAWAHITGQQNPLLDWRFWEECGGISSWAGLLAGQEELEMVRMLQRFTYSGRPLGTTDWYDRLETELNIRVPKSVRLLQKRIAGMKEGKGT